MLYRELSRSVDGVAPVRLRESAPLNAYSKALLRLMAALSAGAAFGENRLQVQSALGYTNLKKKSPLLQ
jgi:hypothetical protein